MMDPTIVGLVAITIIVLVIIWVFRHRIKITIKGPAGMSLELEAENVPHNQVPMASIAETRKALLALVAGNASDVDLEMVREALASGALQRLAGERAVEVGGDANGSTIVTGDKNVVVSFPAAEAAAIDRAFEKLFPSRRRKQALEIAREIGDRRGEGNALGNLGTAYRDLGETRRVIEFHEQNLEIAREIDDRRGEGISLYNLGRALAEAGERGQAITRLQEALKILEEFESPHVDHVRNVLAQLESDD